MTRIFGYIVMAVIVLFIIFAIIVVARLFRERTRTMNNSLPDLNKINKDDESEEKEQTVSNTDGFKNSDALNVSSKTKVNRSDYITDQKQTTFEDDFGHVFDSEKRFEEEQNRKKHPKEVKIETNKVDLPNLDETNNSKKDGE